MVLDVQFKKGDKVFTIRESLIRMLSREQRSYEVVDLTHVFL